MMNEEFDKQKADTSKRFYLDHRTDDEFGYRVIDRTTGRVLGYDGGEPEDQLLVRDWQWVVEELNALSPPPQGTSTYTKHYDGATNDTTLVSRATTSKEGA